MAETTISVGLGELFVSKDPTALLAAHGLGSCIGVLAYDSISRVAGLAHILLPDSTISKSVENKAKFADTAVPMLIEQMAAIGAIKANLVIKIAGGAQMFSIPGMDSRMNIGLKNLTAVKEALKALGLSITSEETGGNAGRTVKLRVKDGSAFLRTTGLSEREF